MSGQPRGSHSATGRPIHIQHCFDEKSKAANSMEFFSSHKKIASLSWSCSFLIFRVRFFYQV